MDSVVSDRDAILKKIAESSVRAGADTPPLLLAVSKFQPVGK